MGDVPACQAKAALGNVLVTKRRDARDTGEAGATTHPAARRCGTPKGERERPGRKRTKPTLYVFGFHAPLRTRNDEMADLAPADRDKPAARWPLRGQPMQNLARHTLATARRFAGRADGRPSTTAERMDDTRFTMLLYGLPNV